jgi:Ca2+-binding RTX toxin-like protein
VAALSLEFGLPRYDYRVALVDVLTAGEFQTTGTNLDSAVLVLGDITLTIVGSGLNVSGTRAIGDGIVTALHLWVDGRSVAHLDLLPVSFTGGSVQSILDAPPPDAGSIADVYSFEPVYIFGSPEAEYLHGTDGNDTIDGGDERDTIVAGDGDDIIYAKDNIRRWGDHIQPGLGTNTIIATAVKNDAHDVSFSDLQIDVTIDLAAGVATGAGMHTTFTKVHWISGGGGNDRLLGSTGAWEGFVGSGGNDTINGRGGYDVITYIEEAELLSMSANGDWHMGDQGVVVNLGKQTATDTFGSTDRLVGIEGVVGSLWRDDLTGDSRDNRLDGHKGPDVLNGGDGDDTLIGGLGYGSDTLTGGADKDIFIFNETKESTAIYAVKRDYITDFKHGTDDIDLSSIDANTTKGGNQSFQLDARGSSGTAVAKGHIGWYQVNKSGNANDRTIIKVNVDNDATIEMEIELKGLITLTSGDFIL